MSLKAKFKTNTSLVNDGVWFTVCTNTDGTTCRVKLRRTGQGNALWSLAWRNHQGDDLVDLTPAQDAEFMAKVYADAVVAGWEHMQPNDDGKDWEFTKENVVKLLGNLDWLELKNDWREKADSLAPFQDPREDDVKN